MGVKMSGLKAQRRAVNAAFTKARDAFDAFEAAVMKAKADLEQKLAVARKAVLAAHRAQIALPPTARKAVATLPGHPMHVRFPDNPFTAAQTLVYMRERPDFSPPMSAVDIEAAEEALAIAVGLDLQ
jgi:hypothetical protein